MQTDLAANSFDLFECTLNGCRPGDRSRNVDGEKDRVEAAFAHARNVNAAVRVARAKIEFGVEQTLRRVVVSVHDNRAEMQVVSFLGNGLRLWLNSEQWQNPSKQTTN